MGRYSLLTVLLGSWGHTRIDSTDCVISSTNTSVVDSMIYGYALSASNPPYSNIGGYGIGVLDNSVGSVVSRNQITSGAVGIGLQQISASGDGISDSIITDNIISDQNGYGIMLYSFGGGVREIYRTVIGSNYITRIYGSMNNTATSSKSFGAGIYLLTVHDVSVVNNVISYTNLQTDSQTLAPAAIGVSQGRSVSVTGNILRQYPGGYPGVYMVTSGTSDVSGSRSISGNSMENCGISLNSMRDVSITGNSIKNAGTFGVTLTNSSFISVEANRISSLATTGGFRGGIVLDSASTSNILSGNHIEVAIQAAACISDSGTRTLITGNYLSGADRAIQTLGAAPVVTNNYAFGATTPYVLSVVPSYVANNVAFPASSSSVVYYANSPFSQTLGGTTTVTVNGIQYGLVDCAAGTRVITNLGGGVAGQIVTLAATNGAGANFTATGVTTKPFVYITAGSGQTVTFLRLDTAPVATWVLISTTA